MTTPARAGDISSTGPGPTSGAPASFPRLEKYELLEEIGHGGMATVYRARDPRLSRDVAVKVIHKHLRENAEVARRFLAEARAAAKLRHASIVEVFDVSTEEDSERYLVCELLRGTTLRKVLQQHREMPAEVGASIVLQLCEALDHAHESGIIHRDVKPENVLVELPTDRGTPSGRTSAPEGKDDPGSRDSDSRPSDRASERKKIGRLTEPGAVIKLTDFGIAKVVDAQGVTSTGQVLGSPAHMAPEQIEAGEVDSRTDVFALGVLMYECLVGHLPFEGKNPAQVLRRVLDGAFSPADRERATVGCRWGKIVAGALARDAQDRTATPAQLAEEIRGELEALGIEDSRAEVTAFFADPAGYSQALTARLVPRLVARGEALRKEGDVTGAASDFNRALALSPSDLSILKRVTTLTSNASRRELARRVGVIAAGSVVLGFAAFGIARQFKDRPVVPPSPVVTAESTAVAPSASANATNVAPLSSASARATSSAEKPKHVASVSPSVAPTATAVVSSSPRKVKFQINPRGASLKLDGNEQPWLGVTLSLAPGSHAVDVAPPTGSGCCKPLKSSVTIAPAPSDDPDVVQEVSLQLELLPAHVRLVGGPSSAECNCTMLSRVFRSANQDVTLPKAEWNGSCSFSDPSDLKRATVNRSVTLRAGEKNDIPWPGP